MTDYIENPLTDLGRMLNEQETADRWLMNELVTMVRTAFDPETHAGVAKVLKLSRRLLPLDSPEYLEFRAERDAEDAAYRASHPDLSPKIVAEAAHAEAVSNLERHDQNGMTQPLIELIEDTLETFRDEIHSTAGKNLLSTAMLGAHILGEKEEEERALNEIEHIHETLEKIADKRNFDAADLMAFLFLINEYEGTPSQTDDGRIFTTMNLASVGPKIAGYECGKFYLPNGDIEFQVIRKGGKPAPASTVVIDEEPNQ